MKDLFDFLINSSDYINDSILISELTLNIWKNTFDIQEKNQAYLVDKYKELKTKQAKECVEKAIKKGFEEMQKTEKKILEAEKDLKEIHEEKNKIL